MNFLKIPFVYSATNIRPNDMNAGLPSMTAISGMAHRVQCIMREQLGITTFAVRAFSIIYFNMNKDVGTPRRPPQKIKGNDAEMPALFDFRRAHGEAELVVAFDVISDDDFVALSELIGRNDFVQEVFSAGLRFAGGEVFIGTSGEFGNLNYGVHISKDWDSALNSMMRAYPTKGQLIQCKQKLLSDHARKNGLVTMKALMDICFQSKKEISDSKKRLDPEGNQERLLNPESFSVTDEDLGLSDFDEPLEVTEEEDSVEDDRPYLGMLMPATIGYHELCKPRGDQYFVEPVLSLVRARILPSLKRDLLDFRESWQDHFWEWKYLPNLNLHIATKYNQQ